MKTILVSITCILLSGCAGRAVNNAVDRGTAMAPHVEPVCMLKSPLPSSIRYSIVGEINSSQQFYGSSEPLIPLMADEARKMGADAVVNLKLGHKMGMLAWSRPYGLGTGVKLANPGDLNCLALGGELR
jgi:uncharacterized protein YbjQ (UPF0145 family)